MKCFLCNHINTESARFCVECGAPFYKRCNNCGKESLFSNKFCPNCGNAFNAQQDALIRYKRKLTFYDSILARFDNLVVVGKDGMYGILNISMQYLIIACEFEDYIFDSKDFVILKKNNNWYIYNPSTGNKISKDSFEEINWEAFEIGDGYRNRILAKKDGLWGCVEYSKNSNVKTTIPFEFLILNTIPTFYHPQPSQHKNGKWGVIWANGNKILDFEYDEIISDYNSLYYLRKGNLWGLFYSGGNYSNDVFYDCIYKKEELNNLEY